MPITDKIAFVVSLMKDFDLKETDEDKCYGLLSTLIDQMVVEFLTEDFTEVDMTLGELKEEE
jgi:hypothetical protein